MKDINPLYQNFGTTHEAVPFDKIRFEHFEPAIRRGLELAKADINAICENADEPTFENTIVALDNAGQDLDRALNVFYPLLSANSDEAMMELSVALAPELSDYSTSITLNRKLWERVKHVWERRESYNLDDEDRMLLEETYDSFSRSGANLEGEKRKEYKKLAAELSRLTTLFGQNVQKELPTYQIWLSRDDLAGLPESTIDAAAKAAREAGREGEFLFTLDLPVYIAFMKYSDRRDLRERMYRLYTGRNIEGEYSNLEILKAIANTRLKIANLLGYETFADYKLHHTMAQQPANVMNLLNDLRESYHSALQKELDELKQFAKEELGFDDEIRPWDYSYYANKLKQSRYSFDEETLRPYFELDSTIKGVFGLATKLYGISFKENEAIPVYHPDVKAFEVTDEDGSYLGIIYTDFFPRASKRPGAWMTDFKSEWIEDGKESRPHVSIVMNFTKPTDTKPSLLTPYEVETFLHEFGHALHGLFAKTKYKSLSGTNVYRDFVELPSQFNENFMRRREFLDSFARHYQTGESLPQEEIDRLIASSRFGVAYACYRQLNFGYLDMAWHSITNPMEGSIEEFEHAAGKGVAMFEPIEGSLISPQFSHIFAGGYAAGYYSYKWAEVLDADAFAAFEEEGVFNRETARRFRECILSKGGTRNPADLYRDFRGRDASVDALLCRDGISHS